jgi:8-oxo-dGTP diphosphatase
MEKPEEHFIGRVAMKAIIVRSDGAILISRDVGEDLWDLPGGRLNAKENPKDALIREVYEELGVHIRVHEAVYLDTFTLGQNGAPHFLVVCKATVVNESEPFVLAPDEIAEARWVTEKELKGFSFWQEYNHAFEAYFAFAKK